MHKEFFIGYILGTAMLVICLAFIDKINEPKEHKLCLDSGASVEYCEKI